ncbi:MAG: DUF4783 domain-containing protein [Bacteroidales bacterium]|nr:DUF4783 domain-containing protein [Bacteroidales bacterium]
MKNVLRIIIFCFSVIIFSSSSAVSLEPAGIVEDIAAAIRAGNSKDLSKYFGPTVEIILPGSDGVFSKAQAEMIMKAFFAKSAPVSFVVNQNRNSAGGAQFIIGTYKSKTEKLNVYILLKPVSNQLMIQQIHFETD